MASASAVFGTLQEFQPDWEIIIAYLERTKVYFTANDVADEKKVAVLLTVIGPKIFTLLRSLTTPELPQDKSFEELEVVLKAHFQPKLLVIAERFYFHSMDQVMGESIADYVTQLCHLSAHCEFGEYLNDALRDRLVCGMRSENAQKRLLSESDLTFKCALELSQGMEAAERNAKALKGTETAIKKSPLRSTRKIQLRSRGSHATDAADRITMQASAVLRMRHATTVEKKATSHPHAEQRKAAAGNLGQGRTQKHSMLLQPRRTAPRTIFSCTRLVRSRLAQ